MTETIAGVHHLVPARRAARRQRRRKLPPRRHGRRAGAAGGFARAGDDGPGSPGTARAWAKSRCAGRSLPAPTTRYRWKPKSLPPTAGCARATWPAVDELGFVDQRPHQGPDQVRRRMDQLGRPGKRPHGPPGRGRGGCDRHTGRQMERAPAGLRGVQGRAAAAPEEINALLLEQAALPNGNCPSATNSSMRCRAPPPASSGS
jgi:hypothetical protein